ncbi:hypothetical protein RJ640_026560 [Escallonia rubra]|uniref:Pentatricopeptide repeat-containing protein n=1 Tax=Escallonia rubra TaxID=112253 RepID=A0AA88UF98_9ASTE|nr:hypothetical protein RJ640_026560 [Escallonia rubra]
MLTKPTPISIQTTIRTLKNKPNPSPHPTSTIRSCISQGALKQALQLYTLIRRIGTYQHNALPSLLKACASLSIPHHGKALHAESIKTGTVFNVMVGTSLIGMYAKTGDICFARKVFDEMPDRNLITWNAMIGGYMGVGDTKTGSFLFDRMPDKTVVTWIEMIDGHAKSGDTATARQFFDRVPAEIESVATWTAMVDGYVRNGEMDAARELFEAMPRRNFFVWSCMTSGYFKEGNVKEAEAIFDRIPVRNLVNWNSLISGYAQNGCCEEALDAFRKMQAEGLDPDGVSFASALSACAQLGCLDAGQKIHELLIRKGVEVNRFILNGLVDMYVKCGDLANARLIFEGILERNSSCWNSMILGLAIHGECEAAIELFGRMENSSEKPDETTFMCVLSACAHGGFVNEGLEIFSKMDKYGLTASIKHFGCLIDLLGRAGRLKEAYDVITKMPMKPNDTIWGALLGACRIHFDTDLADLVLGELNKPDSDASSVDKSHYVSLSNIYAASEKWEKARKMRVVLWNKGFEKTPGHSLLSPNTIQEGQ